MIVVVRFIKSITKIGIKRIMLANLPTIILLLALTACKKPFNANLTSTATNFLAVDGAIISGDSTIITLSRTTKINDTTQKKVELKATLSVESDEHVLLPFTEKGKGQYVLKVTTFDLARTYRLNIKTSDGKVYQSDYVPVKITPPIDSVYFKQTPDSTVTFYVNAHDASNQTRYYRWDYIETWPYVSLYAARFQYKGGQILPITPGSVDDVSMCYKTLPSNQIFVGSSANIANDIITAQPLGSLVTQSEKIAHIYVMQLRQYALTKAGFDYYQNLKSNTEQLGTIFDPQPTTTKGNIHCLTSPNDLVIGFVSISTVARKQLNVHPNDVPLRVTNKSYGAWTTTIPLHYYANYYFGPPDKLDCLDSQISTDPYFTFAARLALVFTTTPGLSLIDADPMIQSDAPAPNFVEPTRSQGIGYIYYYAPTQCVDCRVKGYSNIRPSYYPPF